MKIEELHKIKAGKLFDVKYLTDGYEGTTYVVKVNADIDDFVGHNDKLFESYLRKSFRHFYNLDKKLKVSKKKGRLAINKL
jgi:hypothetical protein